MQKFVAYLHAIFPLGIKAETLFYICAVLLATVIFNIGFSLQQIIEAIVESRFHPFVTCKNFILLPLSLLTASTIPSVIFCMGWAFSGRGLKSSLVLGVLSLMIVDIIIWIFFKTASIHLQVSLISDLIGGPVAGVFIGYFLRCFRNEFQVKQLQEASVRCFSYLSASVLVVLMIFFIIYILFFKSFSPSIVLTIKDSEHGLFVLKQEEKLNVQFKENSVFALFEKEFPMDNVQLIKAKTSGFVINSNSGILKIKFPNAGDVGLKVTAFEGCTDIEKIIEMAKKSDGKSQYFTVEEGNSVQMQNPNQKLVIRSGEENVTLHLNNGVIQRGFLDNKLILEQINGATTSLNLTKDTVIILSARPSMRSSLIEINQVPETSIDYEDVEFSLQNNMKNVKSIKIPAKGESSCECSVIDLNKTIERTDNVIIKTVSYTYVIKVEEIEKVDDSFLKIGVPKVANIVYTPNNSEVFGQSKAVLNIKGYAGDVKSGLMSLGVKNFNLENDDVQILGNNITATSYGERGVIIKGDVNIVSINGENLNKNYISSIRSDILIFFIASFFGAIGYLLKRRWKHMFKALIFGKKFPF